MDVNMIAMMLGAFAAVLWVQHRNHQADWRDLLAILTAEEETDD